ncbi:uncharacterized protein LOC114531376 [Dendronephthya gigantea]|uniref:uncharacterized protein LOC114531376 n=1 Tax=Dendronephthya gigantea TaxID=151771 RepID=UPI00106C21C9|nr:uncharacterized protein LOC114531376 [Dendronephthya gigantea]
MVDVEERIHCSFVMGKSRLAPLKSVTIPRLELLAAVVAAKLDKTIKKEIDIPIKDSFFWTDSTCVLSYILNEEKRFNTFVANHVSAIHNVSSPSQWNHVDTKSNPADDASRGLEIEDLLKNKLWLEGPEFLGKTKDYWPKLKQAEVLEVKEGDPEVKKCKSFAVTTEPNVNRSLDEMFTRFSS